MFDYEKNYWNTRYKEGQTSGAGSYGEQLQKKVKWLSGLDIKSISEIGCGDFNFARVLMEKYSILTKYAGQDISEYIIDKHNKAYYTYLFTTDINKLPPADLLLCIDVLFHIINDDELELLLQEIEAKWTKYLAITAYEYDQPMYNHVRIRKFDYERFGKPLIREIVEEDGQMYFYLFKKDPTPSSVIVKKDPFPTNIPIDLRQVSCCLLTKEKEYPQEILKVIKQYPFGEVLIKTDSDSPFRKYELFSQAKYDLLYYQDDDAIIPIGDLVQQSFPDRINVAMKIEHFNSYASTRMTMGLGWGTIFPKILLKSLKRYTDIYGEDEIFKRETERILTYLNYPQNRLIFPIQDLPSAYAPDRLWRQPQHYDNIKIVEERCSPLVV